MVAMVQEEAMFQELQEEEMFQQLQQEAMLKLEAILLEEQGLLLQGFITCFLDLMEL